jgi:hypothetical protein
MRCLMLSRLCLHGNGQVRMRLQPQTISSCQHSYGSSMCWNQSTVGVMSGRRLKFPGNRTRRANGWPVGLPECTRVSAANGTLHHGLLLRRQRVRHNRVSYSPSPLLYRHQYVSTYFPLYHTHLFYIRTYHLVIFLYTSRRYWAINQRLLSVY